jgi:hypothetical protein
MSSGILQSILPVPLGVYTIGNSTVGNENQDNDLITGNQEKKETNCDNDRGRHGVFFFGERNRTTTTISVSGDHSGINILN